MWLSRRFGDSQLVPASVAPVWQRVSGRWLRVTGAAGYKKVCCQYFLTKSQCETAQLWPGLAPLTRRKPILGSLSLSLSVVSSSANHQAWAGLVLEVGRGEEKQRGRCQLFVGAEGGGCCWWLDINPSCDAVPAWPGVEPGNCSPNDFLWNTVTECHTVHRLVRTNITGQFSLSAHQTNCLPLKYKISHQCWEC